MQIYLARNGQREGPFSMDEVRGRLASGAAQSADLAWYEGAAGWLPLHQVPGLDVPQPIPPAGAMPPPMPPPMPAQPATAAPAKSSGPAAVWVIVVLVLVGGIFVVSLLAAIAIPNFVRARKRSQATSTLETLRLIDAAMDQYAIETNREEGFACTWADLATYVKPTSPLCAAMLSGTVKDALGHRIDLTRIDHPPQVPAQTFIDTADVVRDPESFWGPYYEH